MVTGDYQTFEMTKDVSSARLERERFERLRTEAGRRVNKQKSLGTSLQTSEAKQNNTLRDSAR